MTIDECDSEQFLMSSEIKSGGYGPTGYGGRDTDGSKDPASRLFGDWDEDEDEE